MTSTCMQGFNCGTRQSGGMLLGRAIQKLTLLGAISAPDDDGEIQFKFTLIKRLFWTFRTTQVPG